MGAGAMLISTALNAGATAYGSYQQSKALKNQGRYAEQVAEGNARMLELNAEDALARGQTEVTDTRRKSTQIKGAQRAALASQGVDVNTGSPGAIQDETTAMSEADILTAQNNAWREAWGYKTQASNERFEGRFKRLANKQEARNTLITGGLKVAGDVLKSGYLYGQSDGLGGSSSGYVPRNPTEAKFDSYYRRNRR